LRQFPRFVALGISFLSVLIAQAHVRQQNATVQYLSNSPQQCKVVVANDQTWIQESVAHGWGWTFSGSKYDTRITSGANTAVVDTKNIAGDIYIPLERALRQLDGELVATDSQRTNFLIVTHVRVVRFVDRHVQISASLPFTPTVHFSNPTTLEIDVNGATLSPDVIMDLAPGITVTQPSHSEIRFVVQDVHQFDPSIEPVSTGTDLDFNAAPIVAPPAIMPGSGGNSAAHPTQMQFDLGSAGGQVLGFPLAHALSGFPVMSLSDNQTINIRFPGIRMTSSDNGFQSNELISKVDLDPEPSYTLATVHLVKPCGFLGVVVGNQFQLRFYPSSNSKSASPVGGDSPSLIEINPGHGGHDDGAENDYLGVKEKNLTLLIGYQVAKDLALRGAAVYLTRATDTFVSLSDISRIANQNHVKLFVSIHINSSSSSANSGSITFFHGSDSTSHDLATKVESQLIGADAIPAIGCWSDTRIYSSGFSVLRNASMPAILAELGFINCPHDLQQLIRPEVQEKIAAGIEQGVENFVSSH